MTPATPPLNNLLRLLAGIAIGLLLILGWQHWQASTAPATPAAPPIAAATAKTPAIATPSASEATPSSNKDAIVLELFNPSDEALTHQLNTTNLSQRIEQALTISYVLKKCGQLTDTDYRDNFRALILYAQRTGLASTPASAEAAVRHISESSGASYSLIYSRISCTHPQLPTLAAQLKQWDATLLLPSP